MKKKTKTKEDLRFVAEFTRDSNDLRLEVYDNRTDYIRSVMAFHLDQRLKNDDYTTTDVINARLRAEDEMAKIPEDTPFVFVEVVWDGTYCYLEKDFDQAFDLVKNTLS